MDKPTNGSGRKSKGTKEVKSITDQDQIGILLDIGARSSNDKPLVCKLQNTIFGFKLNLSMHLISLFENAECMEITCMH